MEVVDELSALKKQNAELMKLLKDRENDPSVEEARINPNHTDLVRIEVTKSKGDFAPREFSDQEIVSIWSNSLAQPIDIVDQFDQHRLPTGYTLTLSHFTFFFKSFFKLGTGRVIYRLKKSVDLQAIAIDPYFWVNRCNQLDTVTYTCKILDFNLLPPAKLGTEVTVSVRHTHAEVSKGVIDQWLKLYGTLTSESRFISSSFFFSLLNGVQSLTLFRFELNQIGFKTENYRVELKLNYHIPEFLPIGGKRARIFYHGIPSFCGKCHKVGHLKVDCRSQPATWLVKLTTFKLSLFFCLKVNLTSRFDFIKRLRDSGVHDTLFGAWLESNPVEGPVILENVAQPVAEKEAEVDLTAAVNLLSQLITQQSASKPTTNEEQPTTSRFGFRGRGRGRGGRGTKRRLSDGDQGQGSIYKKINRN